MTRERRETRPFCPLSECTLRAPFHLRQNSTLTLSHPPLRTPPSPTVPPPHPQLTLYPPSVSPIQGTKILGYSAIHLYSAHPSSPHVWMCASVCVCLSACAYGFKSDVLKTIDPRKIHIHKENPGVREFKLPGRLVQWLSDSHFSWQSGQAGSGSGGGHSYCHLTALFSGPPKAHVRDKRCAMTHLFSCECVCVGVHRWVRDVSVYALGCVYLCVGGCVCVCLRGRRSMATCHLRSEEHTFELQSR